VSAYLHKYKREKEDCQGQGKDRVYEKVVGNQVASDDLPIPLLYSILNDTFIPNMRYILPPRFSAILRPAISFLLITPLP
jgi:hypothetical protein